jgi:hypothetical protein
VSASLIHGGKTKNILNGIQGFMAWPVRSRLLRQNVLSA